MWVYLAIAISIDKPTTIIAHIQEKYKIATTFICKINSQFGPCQIIYTMGFFTMPKRSIHDLSAEAFVRVARYGDDRSGLPVHPIFKENPTKQPLGPRDVEAREEFVVVEAEIFIMEERYRRAGEALTGWRSERKKLVDHLFEDGNLRSLEDLEAALIVMKRQAEEIRSLFMTLA